jgi:predicted nicotinamide N-methyase
MKLPLLPTGASLKLVQADGVLGGQVWPAASALCHCLAALTNRSLDCVELGSGTGAVGLYAAALGFSVTLTEHRPPLASVISSVAYSVDGTPEEDPYNSTSDRLLKLLESNVDRNRNFFPKYLPKVKELDWNNDNQILEVAASSKSKKGFELVLASDVTYLSPLHQSLADTIAGVLMRTSDSRCLLSHQPRIYNLKGWDSQLTEFEKSLTRAGLTIVNQTFHPVAEGFKTHKVSILEIQHFS